MTVRFRDTRLIAYIIACVGLMGGNVAAQTTTYSLGSESELLDADFYAGKESPGSAVVEAASGRTVLNLGVNNAGDQALLWGINLGTFQQGLFIVEIGAPDSWRRLSDDQAFAYAPIVWLGDDIHAFVGIDLLFNTVSEVLTVGHEGTIPAIFISNKFVQ